MRILPISPNAFATRTVAASRRVTLAAALAPDWTILPYSVDTSPELLSEKRAGAGEIQGGWVSQRKLRRGMLAEGEKLKSNILR